MDDILQASWSHPRITRTVQHKQINQCDTPYLQKKDKNHSLSIDAEKAFDKIQHHKHCST